MLAHDLEIRAEELEGEVTVDGDAWKTELRFAVTGLKVVGAVKRGRVDESVLSAADKDDIDKRIREAVRGVQVKVVAEGSSRGRATATVIAPEGRQRIDVSISAADRSAGDTEVKGQTRLSLKALGVREVKAPLGVFKLDDSVEVAFRLVLKPAAT